MAHPQKWTGKGVPSYDDRQNGAKLSQCLSCSKWFWFTAQPAPDHCAKCREAKP